jgi:hypothetical protein
VVKSIRNGKTRFCFIESPVLLAQAHVAGASLLAPGGKTSPAAGCCGCASVNGHIRFGMPRLILSSLRNRMQGSGENALRAVRRQFDGLPLLAKETISLRYRRLKARRECWCCVPARQKPLGERGFYRGCRLPVSASEKR